MVFNSKKNFVTKNRQFVYARYVFFKTKSLKHDIVSMGTLHKK